MKDRDQMTEIRYQRTENGRPKSKNRRKMSEDGKQRSDNRFYRSSFSADIALV